MSERPLKDAIVGIINDYVEGNALTMEQSADAIISLIGRADESERIERLREALRQVIINAGGVAHETVSDEFLLLAPEEVRLLKDKVATPPSPSCLGVVEALGLAVSHIEHMAAWITKQHAGYSFESLGEDMPGIRAAAATPCSLAGECDAIAELVAGFLETRSAIVELDAGDPAGAAAIRASIEPLKKVIRARTALQSHRGDA